jgi:hypothetical protein
MNTELPRVDTQLSRVDSALSTLTSLHSTCEGVHNNTPVDTGSSVESSSVWDAIQELETDPDYIEWVREVWQPLLKDKDGHICAEKAFLQWRSQGGVCAATGTVLVGIAGGKGLYSPALVAVNPNRPLSEDDNCKFVAHFVACLLHSLDRYHLSWGQFLRLVTSIDDEEA